MNNSTSRRQFLQRATTCAAGTVALPALASTSLVADTFASSATTSNIYTSLKWGMIEGDLSVLEKFQLCKELGYDGVELVSPLEGLKVEEVLDAASKTEMFVPGVVDMKHWDVRLSAPEQSTRQKGVGYLKQAIHDAHALHGDSVLLVPGKVNGEDENHDHVWQRSIEGIRQVLPLASRLGVRILIENVWNGFCETPEQLRDYVDEIDSPWVGVYFDIGNAWTFSPSQEWIRTLGSRIVKLDVKGWGEEEGFCKIGDGDIQWDEVRIALQEIGFTGWCTAEVPGGNRKELDDISQRMKRVLAIR